MDAYAMPRLYRAERCMLQRKGMGLPPESLPRSARFIGGAILGRYASRAGVIGYGIRAPKDAMSAPLSYRRFFLRLELEGAFCLFSASALPF